MKFSFCACEKNSRKLQLVNITANGDFQLFFWTWLNIFRRDAYVKILGSYNPVILVVWLCGYNVNWLILLFGCVVIQLYGYMVIYLYGYMVIQLYGYVFICLCDYLFTYVDILCLLLFSYTNMYVWLYGYFQITL